MSKINEYLKTALFILFIMQVGPSIISHVKHQWIDNLEPRNKIGYLCITDSINNSSSYRKILTSYFQNSSIKGILLKIESGGGAAGSCQALAFEIEMLKKEFPKPIITYTENMCASGAYEIAAATDYIVATGSAVIGSIGARIAPVFNVQELLKQYHVDCQEIAAGEFKNTLSPFNLITDEQKLMLQSLADNTYQQLTKEIAHKRHLQMNKLDQWGQGKLFTGQQAYDLKLVDALGSKTTAINLLKKNIIPSDRKIEWVTPPAKSKFEMLWGNSDEDGDDVTTNQTSIFDSFFTALFKKLSYLY
ncbi:signal peptide peptidase SppA [Candidatus Babeliales bacterium]|nr:signal peptide peptidase SppA [Candidatus Babeliales bacterium]MBP9843532.1 signal peptide peptidase SppA [Candidatus Babeliales bacterium]